MEHSIQNSITDEILKQASLLYNTNPKAISYVGGFENFVYEFKKDDKDYILRFVHSNHRSHNLVLAEIEFIDYLAHHNAPVSTVIHSINNKIVEKIELTNNTYLSVSVFTKAPGTYINRNQLNEEIYHTLGKHIGLLHKLTKSYKPHHKRHIWYEENYIEEALHHLEKEDLKIIDLVQKQIKKIKEIPRDINNYGLIHTDLHFGNMYIDQGQFTFFDFDDASYKYFVSDIAIVLFYHFHARPFDRDEITKQAKHIIKPLLEGYKEENLLDKKQFEFLNDFLKLRLQVLYLVLVATGTTKEPDTFANRFVNNFREVILKEEDFLNLEEILDSI